MKNKIKLRDLTPEQYSKYKMNCNGVCSECIFRHVYCRYPDKDCWVLNKDMYSDKFLDQKLEIETPTITAKERKYLHNLLEPFKDRIIEIVVYTDMIHPKYANLIIKTKSIVETVILEEIYLPLFKIGTMYKGLKENKKYKDDELKELLIELKLL